MSRSTYSDIWPTRYRTGMWVWVLHRLTGLGIALYGIAHIVVISFSQIGAKGAGFDWIMDVFQKPWVLALELVLLAAVLYHTLNGLRVILFDLGIGIRAQKPIFWGLMGVGAVIMVAAVITLWPFLMGQPMV